MTDWVVFPSVLAGSLDIPASKSHSMRAIILASLADGISHIHDPLNSPDVQAAILACRQFGAKISETESLLIIEGTGGKFYSPKEPIDAQNSGQILRFIGALAALGESQTIITGDESIQERRTVAPLIEALRQLGARAHYLKQHDKAPIVVQGKIQAGKIKMNGQDSQPVSGLLMLSAFLEGVTEIEVLNPGEKPWIDLTLYWLDKLNVVYEREGYSYYKVYGKKKIAPFNYKVGGDFSSACFGGAIAMLNRSTITLNNLDMQDPQGDKKVFDLFAKMGASVEVNKTNNAIIIQGRAIKGMEINVNDIIDAIAILAVVGCFASEKVHLTNAKIARYKESDRITAICQELKKMGAKIHEEAEGIVVYPSKLHGATLQSHFDHRIAMSLVIAALHAQGKSQICHIDCINKSYPNFMHSMRSLGAQIESI